MLEIIQNSIKKKKRERERSTQSLPLCKTAKAQPWKGGSIAVVAILFKSSYMPEDVHNMKKEDGNL